MHAYMSYANVLVSSTPYRRGCLGRVCCSSRGRCHNLRQVYGDVLVASASEFYAAQDRVPACHSSGMIHAYVSCVVRVLAPSARLLQASYRISFRYSRHPT